MRVPTVVPELAAAIGPEPTAALLSAAPAPIRDRLRDCLQSLMTRDPAEIGRLLDSLVARLSAPGQSNYAELDTEGGGLQCARV